MRLNQSMLLHWKSFFKGGAAVFSVSSTYLGTEQKYRAEGTQIEISVTQKAEKELKPESSMYSSHLSTPLLKFMRIPDILCKHLMDLVSTPMGYEAGFLNPKWHRQI